MLLIGGLCAQAQIAAQSVLLDRCDDPGPWTAFASTGVNVDRTADLGTNSVGLRFDVEFTKGSGYGGVFRNFDQPLPENYQLVFWMKATVPVNNFEVKVSDDSTGEDIWWVNTRNYEYPMAWKKIVVKKRHLGFAWGPRPTPHPTRLCRLEVVVTAGSGGKGSVWIDEIELQTVPPVPATPPSPVVTSSSTASTKDRAGNVVHGMPGGWMSKGIGKEWIQIDYGYPREFGGIRLDWAGNLKALNYAVLGSLDGSNFDTLRNVIDGSAGPVLLLTPESAARVLRIECASNGAKSKWRLDDVDVVPGESLSTKNQYTEIRSAVARRGLYPRYFSKEQSFWTIAGIPDDLREALINEDGMFEVDKQSFSVEPFLRIDGKPAMKTWADASLAQSLDGGSLPIPSVVRSYDGHSLKITLLATGQVGRSVMMARYLIKNDRPEPLKGALVIALRPYQVNPTSQWLNIDGGVSRIASLTIDSAVATVDNHQVFVSRPASVFAAGTIDQGELIERLDRGESAFPRSASDPTGLCSGGFEFPFTLAPGDSDVIIVAVPEVGVTPQWSSGSLTVDDFTLALESERTRWNGLLSGVRFVLPASAQHWAEIVRSNVAYILINKDGHGIQPGSRSYERSWIRDGSLTSSALMKMGLPQVSRDFVDWYCEYQYESGAVPCVVDRRGPDPVPEHDSHGELIFALTEVFRFTGDSTVLRSHWPNIVAAVHYIQSLRAQRMTPQYANGPYYGLVTESISHEGYSAKPMHSYWDNFFVLKGLKDAAEAASVLGKADTARMFDSLATAFRTDLYRSITMAMASKGVEYIPGCVELGDFDATSTTIALWPVGERPRLPQPALDRTFVRYYDWAMQRAKGAFSWDAYTPYELRTVGSFVYLGQKEKAHDLLSWFGRYQRPLGWNHWAEVVNEKERQPRFLGDMPHTWVGSDFINSFRAMFLYERDDDHGIVVGAGLKDDWIREGVGIDAMPTYGGTLTYRISSPAPGSVIMKISGTISTGRTPILVPVDLLSKTFRGAAVNGVPTVPVDGFIRVKQLPASVEISYQQ